MIVRKKYLAGGLLRGLSGQLIKRVVKGDKYKALSKKIKDFTSRAYKGKDKTLKKTETQLRKVKPMRETLEDLVKMQNTKGLRYSTSPKAVKRVTRQALDKIKKYEKQKNLEAKEYVRSVGKTRHFKGGLITKPKLAKRGF